MAPPASAAPTAALPSRRPRAAGGLPAPPACPPTSLPPPRPPASRGRLLRQRLLEPLLALLLLGLKLGVKRGGKAYPIGKPGEWRSGLGGARIMTTWDGKYMLDVGKGYLDLSTGQVKVKPGQDGVKVGGKVMRVLERYSPFMGGGVDIPPDPPDESQRRYLRV